MRSLITGGAGFIGSHVVERCLGLGHEVLVLDDLSGGMRYNVPEGASFIEGSVTDTALVEKYFRTISLRLCVSFGRLCGRGVIALHTTLQLFEQPLGQYQLDQRGSEASGPMFRVYLVNCSLRCRAGANDGRTAADTRRSLRN